MNKSHELRDNVKVTSVSILVEKGKVHYIKGLDTICHCGKSIKIHGSRYNEELKRFETFCPDDAILVNEDFDIISVLKADKFQLIFKEREV